MLGHCRSLKKQRGLSTLGWLCVLLAVGATLTFAFKTIPAYIDNRTVVGAMRSLADNNPSLNEMSTSEIKSQLGKYFTINNVRGEPTDSVKIERHSKKTLITVQYEVRENLMGNLDVVMTFHNVLDSSRPDECCSPSEAP